MVLAVVVLFRKTNQGDLARLLCLGSWSGTENGTG